MPEDSVDIANHYNLWRAVLDQAVQDYAYKGKSKDGLKYKEEVEKWLKYKYDEFKFVVLEENSYNTFHHERYTVPSNIVKIHTFLEIWARERCDPVCVCFSTMCLRTSSCEQFQIVD